jgi:hypothetical protein
MALRISMISAGHPETGLWCPRCLLPARVRITVYMISEDGSSPICTQDWCTECDGEP